MGALFGPEPPGPFSPSPPNAYYVYALSLPKLRDKRSEIIAKANAPIGFYVLALLVVETFIASVAIMGGFSADQKFICLIIGVVLFVLCVGIVTTLSWYKPRNLTYSEASHLEEALHRPEFGSSIKPRSESEVDALPPREPPPELNSGDL